MKAGLSHTLKIYTLLVLTAMLLPSCTNDETGVATRQGYITIHAGIDATFRDAEGHTVALDPSLIPDADSLSLYLKGAEGHAATWAHVATFNADGESYMAGDYEAVLSGRMHGGPEMTVRSNFTLRPDEHCEVTMTATPSEAMLRVGTSSTSSRYSLDAITVYTGGKGFVRTAATDTVMFIEPGVLNAYAHITDRSSHHEVMLALPVSAEMAAARSLSLSVTADGSSLTADVDGHNTKTDLEGIAGADAPTVTPSGFTPGIPVTAPEGVSLPRPVRMSVKSAQTPLRSVLITLTSPIIEQQDLPHDPIDLLNLSPQMREYLTRVGFTFSLSEDRHSVVADFTRLIEVLASQVTSTSSFSLIAVDSRGVCSEPTVLDVHTEVFELKVKSVGNAVVGVNRATLTMTSGSPLAEEGDFSILTTDKDGRYTVGCPVNGMRTDGNDLTFDFTVPEGTSDIPVRILYLGLPRADAVIPRVNPTFTIDTDPFATTAIIHFSGEAAGATVRQITSAVTGLCSITINGSPASVYVRYPDRGLVIINGLSPETHYRIAVTVVPGQPALTAEFNTEKTTQVPMGDFSDWHQYIDYKHLACGGRFSATAVPVVNRQNFVDVSVRWPKKVWASLNAKTFFKGTNPNTWYMQPSCTLEDRNRDGLKAVRITSVGYDHDGEPIADYIQQPGEQLPYSMVVPNVRNRAAGRLWIGSYSYSVGHESRNEGTPFTSRPSALNGFFKYLPDLTDGSDCGTVEVQLVNIAPDGSETVISSGKYTFRTASDYTAFSVPLSYRIFKTKPTHLRIMFCSSNRADGPVNSPDLSVPVTADPRNAVMQGSTLWVSQLSFSY